MGHLETRNPCPDVVYFSVIDNKFYSSEPSRRVYELPKHDYDRHSGRENIVSKRGRKNEKRNCIAPASLASKNLNVPEAPPQTSRQEIVNGIHAFSGREIKDEQQCLLHLSEKQPEQMKNRGKDHYQNGCHSRCAPLNPEKCIAKIKNVPSADQVSLWSVDEVSQWIADIGFPQCSECFRDQQIDGKALLLLSKDNLRRGLGLKLGPVVKITNHITQIHTTAAQ